MPWTATYTADTDNPRLGTLNAEWKDAAGNVLFSYGRRAIVEGADLTLFVQEAKDALQQFNGRKTQHQQLMSAIENRLNS